MTDTPPRRGPVLIELDAPAAAEPRLAPATEARDDTLNPADAPPIDAADPILPRPRTMEMVTRLVGRPPSRLTRFFLNSGVALFTFLLSIAALNFIDNLLTRYPVLGWIGIALFALFTLAALGMAWREYRAWARFARIDAIQRQAGAALADDSMDRARTVTDDLLALYRDRPEMEWRRKRLADNRGDAFDARTLLTMAETELLAQLDQDARREIEAAARTVAAATALIPLALADVAAALAANLRMIRRMAEIYGGRAGAVGGWRLARTVITHLVATGAVAAGDDLIHTVAGGGVLAKVSRRFGEGVVNGALTARVGIAAMEVCRPLPFLAQPRPKVGNLLTRGLRGLFGSDDRG
ncbi:TIGR01620 family protein [Paracoccus sediminis]|uniref:Putative membrane protein n=1 Tax=Paracoccus sediminis TaxID=1214787 RepID=A0A238VZK8_9RHOB|nr:TIGR01620 family protein [Paracoccus sediminis]TBN51441.1 TIGR01620 family protein [Paracoccus sediminis]SNR39668.1 putative membrane protein [Paracoccus sediminis]